ncbi:MAG: transglutaminase-like domain-containing protein [Desulfobacterales bacterium]
MIKKSSLVILFFIFIVTAVLVVRDIRQSGFRKTRSPVLLKRIAYGFSIRNTSNHVVERAILRVHTPRPESSTQCLQEIHSSQPYDVEYDAEGNSVFRYTFDRIPPYATRIIAVKADLLMREAPRDGSGATKEFYLAEDRYVEVTNPQIRHLARSLKTGDSLTTAQNIFQWIVRNIQYASYVKNNRGALATLQTRQGDCTEMMHLFIALCRAGGVPARGIAGYRCPESCTLRPAQYHNWAEFYAEGRWRLCDPQRRVFMQEAEDYVAFKIIGDLSEAPALDFDCFRVAGADVAGRMLY